MSELNEVWEVFNRINLRSSSALQSKSKTVLHVFKGGELSVQSTPFVNAFQQCNFERGTVQVSYMTTNDVKKAKWTLHQFVSWLLDCDAHFILSHIHQGLAQLQCNMYHIQKELRRLCNHPGFPTGEQLFCPVFLQNKYRYLKPLPHLTNATLKIPLLPTYEGTEWLERIERFTEIHHEGKGYCLKVPYTTNSEFVKFPQTVVSILKWLDAAYWKYGNIISYALLQPQMKSRMEYKVVLLNGVFAHIANNRFKYGKQFDEHPYTKLISFAERAVRELRRVDKSFIYDGLVRVDVFCDACGVYRVNEYESLEANYYAKRNRDIKVEFKTFQFLTEYWTRKIKSCVGVGAQ